MTAITGFRQMRVLVPGALVTVLAGCTLAPATVPTPGSTPAVVSPASTAAASATPRALPSPSAAPARPSPTSAPPSYAPPTTAADGTTYIDLPDFPMFLIPGDDALWAAVFRPDRRDIIRIDPGTNTFKAVVTDLPVTTEPIAPMAVEGSIWVTGWDSDAVTEYDASTGEELARYDVEEDPMEPFFAYGDVWILNHHQDSVSRLEIDSRRIVATIDLPSGMHPIAAYAGGGLLWVGGPRSNVVYGIAPETNTIARTIEVATDCVQTVAYLGERLWVGYCAPGRLDVFDPESGELVTTLEVDVIYPHLAGLVDGDRVWLPWVDRSEGDFVERLVAIDTSTLETVAEFALLERLTAPNAVAAFDSMWISEEGGLLRVPLDALP